MNRKELTVLEAKLWEQIPLCEAMGVKLEAASTDHVLLFAPIKPNINHKKTAFGGSLHALATIACWSLLQNKLLEECSVPFQIVIARSKVDYLAPVTEDFSAECRFNDSVEWAKFMRAFERRGKARLPMNAIITEAGRLCVDYHGTFVAIKLHARQSENVVSLPL